MHTCPWLLCHHPSVPPPQLGGGNPFGPFVRSTDACVSPYGIPGSHPGTNTLHWRFVSLCCELTFWMQEAFRLYSIASPCPIPLVHHLNACPTPSASINSPPPPPLCLPACLRSPSPPLHTHTPHPPASTASWPAVAPSPGGAPHAWAPGSSSSSRPPLPPGHYPSTGAPGGPPPPGYGYPHPGDPSGAGGPVGAGGPPVGSGPGSVASRAPSVDRSMDRSFDRGSVGPGVGYTPRRRGSSASSVGRMSTGGSVSTPLRRANLAEASRLEGGGRGVGCGTEGGRGAGKGHCGMHPQQCLHNPALPSTARCCHPRTCTGR
jgi:hypothetical protein